MFAVKGWSVSADNLKAQVPKAATANGETKKSKKRKRQAQNVDNSNVADLWQSVIDGQDGVPSEKVEGHETVKKAKKDNKRQKRNADQEDAEATKEKTSQGAGSSHGDKKVSLKDKKKAKKAKDQQKAEEGDNASPAKDANTVSKSAKSNKNTTSSAPPPVAAAQPKLTPLQASMREKLISARFRHLNETLYTRPSADALSLFDESPEMFTEYHEGFRRQVEVWPENPVEGYIADIRARARARYPSKHRKQQQQQQPPEPAATEKALEPLPRNRDSNLCTIADLGCGDARLAAELAKDKSKLKVEILSFDLSSPQPFVTKADIANLPLANGNVDVAIFCLALMGTNWVDFIEEAYRILRWKGELWVAEIKSRFGPPGGAGAGGKKVVEHSVGHRRNKAAAGPSAGGKKATSAAAKDKGAADETTLLVEVDGMDDTRQQTDVSAFVKVLNARGFMLAGQDQGRGEEAVDLSNRMFVKMRFIKCAPATKGKCVRKEEAEKSRFGGKLQTMAKKPKFIDHEVEVDEAGVLKPCVYKLR